MREIARRRSGTVSHRKPFVTVTFPPRTDANST
jgi:hypothetical protein